MKCQPHSFLCYSKYVLTTSKLIGSSLEIDSLDIESRFCIRFKTCCKQCFSSSSRFGFLYMRERRRLNSSFGMWSNSWNGSRWVWNSLSYLVCYSHQYYDGYVVMLFQSQIEVYIARLHWTFRYRTTYLLYYQVLMNCWTTSKRKKNISRSFAIKVNTVNLLWFSVCILIKYTASY